jgi:hypothetical protein
MKRVMISLYLVICLLFAGCMKRYRLTANVCDNTLFVEDFIVNPAGVVLII